MKFKIKYNKMSYRLEILILFLTIQIVKADQCGQVLNEIQSPQETITQYLSEQGNSYNVPNFLQNSKECFVDYKATFKPEITNSFIKFDQTQHKIIWQTPKLKGVYLVQLCGILVCQDQTMIKRFDFQLIILEHRTLAAPPSYVYVVASSVFTKKYIVGQSDEKVTFKEFDANGSGCGKDNIYYKLTITSNNGQDTSFIRFSKHNEITWETDNLANAGIYQITITGKIFTSPDQHLPDYYYDGRRLGQNCDISAGSNEDSTTFTLTVSVPITCATSTNQLTFKTSSSVRSALIDSQPNQIDFSNIEIYSSTYCQNSDIVYTASISGDNGQNTDFISFNALTQVISWTSPQVKGVYSVVMTGTIETGIGPQTGKATFKLTIIEDCETTVDQITITPSTIQPRTVLVGSTSGYQQFTYFSVTSSYCTQSDIVYTTQFTSDNGETNEILSFDRTNNFLRWQSPTIAGVYILSIIGTITNKNGNILKQADFVLTVNSCFTTSDSIQIIPSDPFTLKEKLNTVSRNVLVTKFTVQGTDICKQSDIKYTATITADGQQDTSFITFDSANNIISWTSPQITGVFTVTVEGTIQNKYGNITDSTYFQLTILSCATTLDYLQIIPSSIASQTIAVLSGSGMVTVTKFTASGSSWCVSSDIVYTATITSDSSQDTAFITFSATTMQISWTNPVKEGIYITTVTGTIVRVDSNIQEQIEFELTVISCFSTSETISLTSTPIDAQDVALNSVANFVNVQKFTVTGSTYCSQSDIVYTQTITSNNYQSTTFIKFTQTTFNIDWNIPTIAGVFTVTIFGQVNNQFNTIYAQTQFVLTVYSCLTSIDQIKIVATPSTTTQLTQYVRTPHIDGNTWSFSFILTSLYCSQADIVVSIDPIPSSSFITVSGNTLSWTNPPLVGIFTFKVTGQITNSNGSKYATAILQLTSEPLPCLLTDESTQNIIIMPPKAAPKDQQYFVSDPMVKVIIDYFTIVSEFCQKDDLKYKLSVDPTNEFIIFDQDQMTLSWITDKISSVGNYIIILYAEIPAQSQTFSNFFRFNLAVKLKPVNQIPILKYFDDLQVHLIEFDSKDLIGINQIELGPITDPDVGDKVTSTMQVIPQSQLSKYFKFDGTTGILTFDLKYAVKGQSYNVMIQLTDSNTIIPGNNTYEVTFHISKNSTYQSEPNLNFTVPVQQEQVNQTQPIDSSIPYWRKITTSNEGVVTIYFSEKLIIPPNITTIDNSIIDVKLIPFGLVDVTFLNFTWNVTEFTQTSFVVKLNFTNPLYVSSTGRFSQDRIKVTALDNLYFKSLKSLTCVENNTSLIKALPAQLSSNAQANKALHQATDTLDSGSKALTASTFVLNLIMASSLALLWGMINAIQIINLLPSFNLMVPANVSLFFGFMNDISNFNIFPTDFVFDWLGFPQIVDEDQVDLKSRLLSGQNQTQLASQNNAVGQYNVFRSLGAIFLTFLFGLLLLLILVFFYLLSKYGEYKKFGQYFYTKIKTLLFWNNTSRYLLEGYIVLAIQTVEFLKSTPIVSYFESQFNSLQTIYIYLMGFTIVVGPILITIYLYFRFNQFRKK